MIRPRTVVTRRQYDRRSRQKQLIDSLCNCGINATRMQPLPSSAARQRGTNHRVDRPTPLSPLPSNDANNVFNERLEIYDGADTPRPTSMKRRRTPSRVALYRQIDIELEEDESSKSSTNYTDSIGISNSVSVEMGHSLEDTITLEKSVSILSEPTQTSPIGKIDHHTAPPLPNLDDNVPWRSRSTTNHRKMSEMLFSPRNAHSPTTSNVDASSSGVREPVVDQKTMWTEKIFDMQYSCCNQFTSLFKNKNTKKKQMQRPGMSLGEEQRLWRSVLEGDIWDNHYQYVRAASGVSDDNQDVDEIEIVPIENDFKSTGSVNYAESENIGMLFVPTKQFDRKDQRQTATSSPKNDSTSIPWWKRDQWKFSPKSENPGSESHGGTASRARMSVQTKKISNRTEEKNTRPHPYQQQENVETTALAPRLSPIRLERTRSNELIFFSDPTGTPQQIVSHHRAVDDDNEYEEEMIQFHHGDDYFPNEPTTRPFQVYNPKLERRINQHQPDTYDVDSSDAAMMFCIPHLYNSSNKEQVPLTYPKSTPPFVETIEADSESILTDLSELIRQVDERQPENIVINCEEMSQQHETSRNKNLMNAHVTTSLADESDYTSSLQDSREENIAPVLLRRMDHNSAIHQKTPQPYRNEDSPRQVSTTPGHISTTATEQLQRNKVSAMSPKQNKNNDLYDKVTFFDQKPDVSDRHELHYTKHASEKIAKSHRDHSLSPTTVDDDCWNRRNQKVDRGRRCVDLIDLTNLQEQTIQVVPRKRSKSPIRLYGDPPVPQHLDGSPIHCPRKPKTRSDPQKRPRSKSPIRIYGDPPVPQHMDGSPVQYRENTKSKSFLERFDGKVERTSESPRQVWDDDLTILKDILTRRNDIAELIAATSPKGNHSLHDGSKIVMLKPVVNVYKILNEYDDERPISPWRSETSQPNTAAMKKQYVNNNTAYRTKTKSPKVSLQVRTVFSNSEQDIAANYGVGRSEQEPLSPVMTGSIDDDSSIDDELRKLAASEKLLRKELEEVQKRSAVRRWQIDETTSKVKTREKNRHHNVLTEQLQNRQSNMDSPSNGETLTSSVIDLSCIDIELDRENTLISPLPVASAYQCRDTRTNHSWEETQREDSPLKGNVRQQERSCKTDAEEENPNATISLDEAHRSPFLEMDCASRLDIPMTLSDLSQRLWNLYGKNRSVNKGDTTKQSPGSHGLYVPSLSMQNDNPPRENRYFESNGSPSQQFQPDYSGTEYFDTDVIIDREPSWGTIEKLYQLSMQSESYVSNIPNKRDIERLWRNVSPTVHAKGGSNESSNSGNLSDPLFQCIEQAESLSASSAPSLPTGSTTKSYSSSDRENLTDIETLDVFPSSGNTVSEQSYYGALLQLRPRDASVDNSKRTKDPISPRLQSLLVRQKHGRLDEANSVHKTVHTRSNNSDAKAQGIYAELVRRGRHKNKNTIVCTDESPAPAQNDNSNMDLRKSPISSVVQRYAWQSSPAKRLERLRELHREMNARQKKEEDESPLTRRLSPARRRATKSLKHKAVVPQPKRETNGTKNKSLSAESSSNVVVQVYMPVTRSPEREGKKLKKDAECRDLVSLASSSTRSHSLVAALPPAAKARNAASGKPGR